MSEIEREIQELLKSKQELVQGGSHRNAIRLLLDIKEHLEKDNERLNIALHTHQSYDKTVSELREENERLTKERDEEKRHAALGWEQSNKWLEENGRLRAELDQVKKERDEESDGAKISEEITREYAAEIQSLLNQLAEKDKVLVQVIGILKQANVDAFDTGECVRLIESILSQYKKGDTKDA